MRLHRRQIGLVAVFFLLFATTPNAAQEQKPEKVKELPAFPGAEGFGALTPGGRGGRVIEVKNLDDSGPGSFRAALMETGKRIIVFRVGGTIDLKSNINVTGEDRAFVTIAGQTAPGGGIQLRHHGLILGVHDVVMRHLRHRRGFMGGKDGRFKHGITIGNPGAPVYNVVIDHCSFAWQQDDNDVWYRTHDVTFQWCIFAEANNPDKFDGVSGKGFLAGVGKDVRRLSFHHNFMTSNHQRNPAIGADGPTHVVNNVIYNYGAFGGAIMNRGKGVMLNLIGNTYKPGPDTGLYRYEVLVMGEREKTVFEQPPDLIYVKDNFGPHRKKASDDEWAIMGVARNSDGPKFATLPASDKLRRMKAWPDSPVPVTVHSAAENVDLVLHGAGATLPARDAVDTRLVEEFHKATGSLGGDNQWPTLAVGTAPPDSDHDGIPDAWEAARGLDPKNAADASTFAPSGYTWVEEYLNGLADPKAQTKDK